MQELYTGGNDRQILVWSPSTPAFTEMVYHLSVISLQALFVWLPG
jgi:DNA excision repair protein ERCC-8